MLKRTHNLQVISDEDGDVILPWRYVGWKESLE